MAQRDRLTASTLVPAPRARRRAHARRRGLVFEGDAAGLRRARRGDRGAAAPRSALPPAARVRAARPGPPGVGRRPALQRPLPRPPQRAARAGLRRASSSAWPGALFAQRLDRTKPLWEIWLVEGLDGDRFAVIPRPTTRSSTGSSGVDITSVLFDTAPDPAPPPSRRAVDARARADEARAAGRGAARARDLPGRGGARPARADARAAPGRSRRPASGVVGLGAMAWAGRQPGAATRPFNVRDRPAPPLHMGRRATSRASRRSRTSWAAPSTTSCSTAVALALGRFLRRARRGHRRARAQGDGPRVGARRRRARRAGQPRRRRCGRRCRSASRTRSSLRARPRGDAAASRSPGRRSAPRR